jgi:transposase
VRLQGTDEKTSSGSRCESRVKLEHWRQKAEAALEGALKERGTDPASDELAAAMQRIGELSMENELLRAKMGRTSDPLARRRWR